MCTGNLVFNSSDRAPGDAYVSAPDSTLSWQPQNLLLSCSVSLHAFAQLTYRESLPLRNKTNSTLWAFARPITQYARRSRFVDTRGRNLLYHSLRGYLDFRRLYHLRQDSVFFVTRTKSNLQRHRLYSYAMDKGLGIPCDQTVRLTGSYSAKDYPETLWRIKYYDAQTDKILNQQFLVASNGNCKLTPVSLASRAIFQMDQTTSSNRAFGGDFRKCRKDSNLDSSGYLRPRCHHQETAHSARKSLYDITDFECNYFRE